MKTNILKIKAMVLGLLLMACTVMGIYSQQPYYPPTDDNYGIVKIQLLDAVSGKPVNEVFYINLHKVPIITIFHQFDGYKFTSDNNGALNVKLKPGQYYLRVFPKSDASLYKNECWPQRQEKSYKLLTVEKGKTALVNRKVYHGGTLKVILVSPQGERVNPNDLIFNKIRPITDIDPSGKMSSRPSTFISLDVKYPMFIAVNGYSDVLENKNFNLTREKDNLDDGEISILRLPPGEYGIRVDFSFMGIKTQELYNIDIQRDQVTVQKIVIDMNEKPILEGYLKDENGKPIAGLVVKVDKQICFTLKDGYYRIIGIVPGDKIIFISNYLDYEDAFNTFNSFNVTILKEQAIQKNYTINMRGHNVY